MQRPVAKPPPAQGKVGAKIHKQEQTTKTEKRKRKRPLWLADQGAGGPQSRHLQLCNPTGNLDFSFSGLGHHWAMTQRSVT